MHYIRLDIIQRFTTKVSLIYIIYSFMFSKKKNEIKETRNEWGGSNLSRRF